MEGQAQAVQEGGVEAALGEAVWAQLALAVVLEGKDGSAFTLACWCRCCVGGCCAHVGVAAVHVCVASSARVLVVYVCATSACLRGCTSPM